MATHRRPLVDGPPLELVEFRGDDWISDDAVSPYWAWLLATHRRPQVDGPPLELLEFRPADWLPDVSPYWAWLMARFEWCCDHPDDFSLGGDVLDMLRARAAISVGCIRES